MYQKDSLNLTSDLVPDPFSNLRNLHVHSFWDFRDALCRKSLCFFSVKNYEFVNKNKKRYNFETAKGRNLKFRS